MKKKNLCQVDPTVTCSSFIFWRGTFWYITNHKNEKVDYEFFICYCKMTSLAIAIYILYGKIFQNIEMPLDFIKMLPKRNLNYLFAEKCSDDI